MPNKISFSAVSMYLTCGKKYFLHYKKRIRPNTISGALLIGGAIDKALNELVESKNLEKAIKVFDKSFRYNFINNEGFSVPESTKVVYAKKDFDKDLLQKEDYEKFEKAKEEWNYEGGSLVEVYEALLNKKEENGFVNLEIKEKALYNLVNWLSIRRKGHLMLQSWYTNVLPNIKQTLAVQKSIGIENDQGDKITGFLDLVAEWKDGKRYLLDNKTSYMEYESDSASKSQQLILYYHAVKEEFKLDGVGFIVLYKAINKNRTKKCESCGKDGTGQRHKTCDAETTKGRCNGSWIETINPECRIDIILNQVNEPAENLVLETFDQTNEGIKKEVFAPNLDSCNKYGIPCAYARLCWENSMEDLVQLKKEEKE